MKKHIFPFFLLFCFYLSTQSAIAQTTTVVMEKQKKEKDKSQKFTDKTTIKANKKMRKLKKEFLTKAAEQKMNSDWKMQKQVAKRQKIQKNGLTKAEKMRQQQYEAIRKRK